MSKIGIVCTRHQFRTTLGTLVAVAAFPLVVGCAGTALGHWLDDTWLRTADGPGNLAEDIDRCAAEVVAGTQPSSLLGRLPVYQSTHNQFYRRDHMRVCMRDRGWKAESDKS